MSIFLEQIEPPDAGMPNPVIKYHNDGLTVRMVKYCNADGDEHRLSGPAIIAWDTQGMRTNEWWMQDGYEHRDGGPAVIGYREGKVVFETYYQKGMRVRGPGEID